jgi:glycerol-3-phosphate cytidylyltransferase
LIIGYTSGVFDLFHIGHLNLLNNCKSMCDKLVVGVSTDELVMEYKKKNTVIPFHERAEIVRNIKSVDVVIAQKNLRKQDLFEKIKFDVMFVGDDWHQTEKWNIVENDLKKKGVKVVFFPYTETTSSSLINSTLMKLRGESD